MSADSNKTPAKPTNFLRQIIERDLELGTYKGRMWGGSPGDAAHHAKGIPDPAAVRLRFPPEPNGYLHVGHAKSICLNFGLAADYGGVCHLRFDDTNPEKEEQEYVDAIKDSVQWLGFSWTANGTEHLYYASNYFDHMYRFAEYLIEQSLAYVDEQSADEMRANRGDFGKPGTDSPFRSRTPQENLARFREMRDGELPDGAAVLRAKIDMASPNINMRDPTLYRIRRATHHNTGDKWCIYPMYTYAHPIEDALENITHSICTLEFEDQRPFYDWLLENLAKGGLINTPVPKQYEFARLNLTYVVTSKRKLKALVDEGHVDGWDDPRMPTIAGMRRRGYPAEAIRLFADRTGASKSPGWIDYSVLEGCVREVLDPIAPRAMAVLDPVKLVITNWDELMGAGFLDECTAPVNPHDPSAGTRHFKFGKELWIERSDYEEMPPKGFNRLFPGNKVRLKYGHVVTCTGATKDADGKVTEVQAELVPDTKSGTAGSDRVKVKGVISWIAQIDASEITVAIYDRLFRVHEPRTGDDEFLVDLNAHSLATSTAKGERANIGLTSAAWQMERHGYFVAGHTHGSTPSADIHLVTALRDGWPK